MTDQNTTVTRWSDADFGEMSWHDCSIHALGLDQDGEYQSDLVLDLDYIVEWIKTGDGPLRFRVAPALLRFQNVDKLHIQTLLHFKEAFYIDAINCIAKEDKGVKSYHWTINIQSYSEETDNRIEFDATGFVQELTRLSVVRETQNLTRQQREEMKKRNGEQENPPDKK